MSAILDVRPVELSEERLHEEGVAARALDQVAAELEAQGDFRAQARWLLQVAAQQPRLSAADRVKANRVMGCTAQVWLTVERGEGADDAVRFCVDSDSEMTRGLGALLARALSGKAAEVVLAVRPAQLERLVQATRGALHQPSRVNGLHSMLQALHKRTRALLEPAREDLFPSLLITPSGDVQAQGDFAVAQAQYLQPDAEAVDGLVALLSEKKMGVVAHFYMDPQVQGVLVAAAKRWPHIHISDSLVMADRALRMAQAGCECIAVLGVDFMAENARAILGQGGFEHVPVFRLSEHDISCSLAEAAEGASYLTFLAEAARMPRSLHVIYINTSLETKARAHELLPTITCTSSNVVQTVLQAFTQVPDLTVWYGPDTYMGGNLAELLQQLARLPDEEIAKVHPLHTRASIAALLPRLHYFQDGNCIVHDMFGTEVVSRVRNTYGDAYLTAHFEVPGEMFAMAMEARRTGLGCVGSTQTILDFVVARTKEALGRGFDERLKFVLGTESGMITSLVAGVRAELAKGGQPQVEVEIVFPVNSSAISTTTTTPASDRGGGSDASQSTGTGIAELQIVPGVQGGEGCSVAGGCASCPYMKMNTLDALLRVCRLVGTAGEVLLEGHKPRTFSHQIGGRRVVDIGCDPVLHMRHFQTSGRLSDDLVDDILTRNA